MEDTKWVGLVEIARLWQQEGAFCEFLEAVAKGSVDRVSDEVNNCFLISASSGGFFDRYPLLVTLWAQAAGSMLNSNHHTQEILDLAKKFFAFNDRALGLTYWLRAQIPGYPMFFPLGLANGAVLNSPELPLRLPWIRDVYHLSLQYKSEPPWHGFAPKEARSYRNSANKLLAAMKESAIWNDYFVSFEELTSTDISSLKDGRRRISQRLKSKHVDIQEIKNMYDLAELKNQVVSEELKNVTDGARKFSLAFDQLDNFITDISQTLLGWIVMGGHPERVTDFENLYVGPHGRVSFRAKVLLSKLAYIEDPIVPHVFRVVRSGLRSDQLGYLPSECEGIQIPGFPKIYEL